MSTRKPCLFCGLDFYALSLWDHYCPRCTRAHFKARDEGQRRLALVTDALETAAREIGRHCQDPKPRNAYRQRQADERDLHAHEAHLLRFAGLSWKEIGLRIGKSKAHTRQMVIYHRMLLRHWEGRFDQPFK